MLLNILTQRTKIEGEGDVCLWFNPIPCFIVNVFLFVCVVFQGLAGKKWLSEVLPNMEKKKKIKGNDELSNLVLKPHLIVSPSLKDFLFFFFLHYLASALAV